MTVLPRHGPTSITPPAKPAAGIHPSGSRWRAVILGISTLTVITAAALIVGPHIFLSPDRLWDQAQAALHAGQLDQAESNLAWIRRLRTATSSDLMLEAQVAIARNRIDQALAFLAKLPQDDPLFAEACLLSGRLERQRKRVRVAEGHFLRALKINPALVGAHKELIYLYGVQSRRREVDAEFRALAHLTPLTHHDLFTWAQTHFSGWSPDIAADLQAYVDADSEDLQSRLALIAILVDQPEETSRVSQLLDTLPASDPDAQALRVAHAIFQQNLGEAESLLTQSLSHHPALARYRGRLALLRRSPESAVRNFREALSAEPYDRVSTFELGQALALQGDRNAAEVYLARSRRLNEIYNLVNQVRSPAHENRVPDLAKIANAFESAGLLEEAGHWYTLALGRDPLNTEVQRALYRLKVSTNLHAQRR